jgi:hypothetical protein
MEYVKVLVGKLLANVYSRPRRTVGRKIMEALKKARLQEGREA